MIIISILLALLTIAFLMPIIIGILDCYWWLMTEHTLTSFVYSAGRFEGMFLFTVMGVVLFLLTLDVITMIDTGDNNGNKQTTNNTKTFT